MDLLNTATTQTEQWKESLRKRLSLSSFEDFRHFPKFFEIETIRACNSRCSICTIADWNNYGIRMQDELFKKIASEMSTYKNWIQTVCLSRDGEPLLDEDLVNKIVWLKMSGIKFVTLTTNAQLLTEQKARQILESGLDDIMISIDGATRATFEGIRIGLDFDTVVENTKRFIQLRNRMNKNLTVRIRFVITPENKHETESWLAFWQDKVTATDKVYAMPMHTWGNQLPQMNHATESVTPCVFLFSSLAIHADGTVGQCNVDYNGVNSLGDIKTSTIKDIWNGVEINRLRNLHLLGDKGQIAMCRHCSLWDRTYIEAQNS